MGLCSPGVVELKLNCLSPLTHATVAAGAGQGGAGEDASSAPPRPSHAQPDVTVIDTTDDGATAGLAPGAGGAEEGQGSAAAAATPLSPEQAKARQHWRTLSERRSSVLSQMTVGLVQPESASARARVVFAALRLWLLLATSA